MIGAINDDGDTLNDPCGASGLCSTGNIESWGRQIQAIRKYAYRLAMLLLPRDGTDRELGEQLAQWWFATRGLELTDVGLFGWNLPGSFFDLGQAGTTIDRIVGEIRDVQPLLEQGQARTGVAPPARLKAQADDAARFGWADAAKVGAVLWLGFKIYESVTE